jgi:hypothetical protein
MGTRRSAVQRPLNKALVRFEQALFAITSKAYGFCFFACSKRTGSEQAAAAVQRLLAHSDGQK